MKLRRTTLFIPGTLPLERVRETIATCGADLICLDLEDTVAPARKDEARAAIVGLLREDIWGRAARAVRINAVSSPHAEQDVRSVVGGAGDRLDSLFLSKPDSVEEIHAVDRWIADLRAAHGFTNPIGYVVAMESARALTNIDLLASCSPNVEALGFAIGDLSASLGVHIGAYVQDRSLYPGDLFHFHRARIILAARTYGLWALDAPWPVVNDHATLAEDARWGAMMGFDGKLVLAPEQVRTVHEAYRPSEAELVRARDVLAKMERLAAAGEGSGVEEGEFLDAVVIEPARATIARAEAPL
ncbi:MAG: CoA ester lyase [Sphingomonas bacterium]|nr:CoA ester lyase [Sphingomonas bacterium]